MLAEDLQIIKRLKQQVFDEVKKKRRNTTPHFSLFIKSLGVESGTLRQNQNKVEPISRKNVNVSIKFVNVMFMSLL